MNESQKPPFYPMMAIEGEGSAEALRQFVNLTDSLLLQGITPPDIKLGAESCLLVFTARYFTSPNEAVRFRFHRAAILIRHAIMDLVPQMIRAIQAGIIPVPGNSETPRENPK